MCQHRALHSKLRGKHKVCCNLRLFFCFDDGRDFSEERAISSRSYVQEVRTGSRFRRSIFQYNSIHFCMSFCIRNRPVCCTKRCLVIDLELASRQVPDST